MHFLCSSIIIWGKCVSCVTLLRYKPFILHAESNLLFSCKGIFCKHNFRQTLQKIRCMHEFSIYRRRQAILGEEKENFFLSVVLRSSKEPKTCLVHSNVNFTTEANTSIVFFHELNSFHLAHVSELQSHGRWKIFF